MTAVAAAAAGSWPAAELEAIGACPVCGDARRTLRHGDLRDRTFGTAPGTWSLWRCHACASAYLDPRPTRDSIWRAYAGYYTHLEDPAAVPEPAGLRAALANGALDACWGYRVAPSSPAGAVVARLLPVRAALVGRSVRHLHARPGGRLLDVGCGSGAFIAQMARLGWEAEGLEPDADAVAVARRAGLAVTQGTAEELDADGLAGRYDAVTLNHVVEHLHDPAGVLRRIAAILRPGGTLWIATPNLRALGHRRYGPDWLALDPPRHLVLFHRAALESLLARTGYEVLPAPAPTPDATHTFPPSAAIRDGRPTDAGPRHPRATRARAAAADLVAARAGRHAEELVVLARRPGAPG